MWTDDDSVCFYDDEVTDHVTWGVCLVPSWSQHAKVRPSLSSNQLTDVGFVSAGAQVSFKVPAVLDISSCPVSFYGRTYDALYVSMMTPDVSCQRRRQRANQLAAEVISSTKQLQPRQRTSHWCSFAFSSVQTLYEVQTYLVCPLGGTREHLLTKIHIIFLLLYNIIL